MENFLKGKLEELAKERAEYGRRKAEALGRIASLGLKLTNNEILLDNYSAEVSEAKETIRRYENTIAYYDKCAADIERQLEDEQNAARRAKTAKQAIPLAISAMILLATFGIFIASEGAITGFFARETVTAYEQALSISASQAQAYAWQPENAGELRSAAISGKLLGEGTARVYLEQDGRRYLIMDSAELAEEAKAMTSITGLAVAEAGTPEAEAEGITTDAENTTEASNATENAAIAESTTAPAENATEDAAIVPENATSPVEAAPENATIAEKAISISLQYNAGTPFDEDNDGTEFNTSAIDFTVDGTSFSWAESGDKLCTQWIVQPDDSDTATQMCYGSRECCALLELAPESPGWNDEFALVAGLYGAEENNTISSRVIYANYSLEQGSVYSEIAYSSFSSLPATFIAAPAAEETPAAPNMTAIEFNGVCADTCLLSGLNETSYALIIEVENATLEISSIAYTMATTKEIDAKPPIVTIISPRIRVYNTTLLELNFSIDEKADRIWYLLNNGSSVTTAANTTISAINGTNTLALYATDLAGNTGSDEVIFSVILPESANASIANATTNITNATSNATMNITPQLKALKEHFKPGEDAELEFEYASKPELVRAGKWKDEYEGYEDGYEGFLKNANAAKKAAVESAVATEKAKAKRKGVEKLAAINETISAQVFDSEGRKAGIGAEIEELREGKFTIKVPKQRQFRAGKYTLQIQLTKDNVTYTQEQNFTWGVLAINTNKSIFLPNEDVFIAMAVLDDEGHMVCDADATLAITKPDNTTTTLTTAGGEIAVSPECQIYGVTNLPDYYTTYAVNGVGTYIMNLTAATPNGIRSIADNFTVQGSVDFDVARAGPTRIYPFSPYVMNFTINANKNYNGQIIEYVPASFAIKPQEGLTVTTIADAKAISWNAKLKKDDTINLYYEFDAPDTSPEFYLLGALEIGSFSEARQWQIASDASVPELGGLLVYGEGTVTTPRYRNWTGSDFSSEASAPDLGASSTINFVIVKSSTKRNQTAIGILDAQGDILLSVRNNSNNTFSTWLDVASIGTTNDGFRGFDVAVEESTGDFVAVYEKDTTGDRTLYYRTWEGENGPWSGEGTITLNSGVAAEAQLYVVLERRANSSSEEIMLASAGTSDDISVARWNGSAFVNVTFVTTTAAALDEERFSIAWESGSGDAMIVWGEGTTKANYSVWSGTNFNWANGGQVRDRGAVVEQVKICSDPTSDYIGAIFGPDGSADVLTVMWDGTQWLGSEPTEYTTGEVTAEKNAYCAWTKNTSVALFGFVDLSDLGILYLAYNRTQDVWNCPENGQTVTSLANAEGSNGPCYTGNIMSDDIDVLRFIPDPNSNNIMVLSMDFAEDLNMTIFDGDTIKPAASGILEQTTPTITGAVEPADFDYYRLVTAIAEAPETTPPNNSIILPLQKTNLSGSFLVNASVNETGGTVAKVNVTLYNNTGNATGLILMSLGAGTTTSGYWNATINTAGMADGNYNISVNATDNTGNINISQNVSITIDNTKANVSSTSPANLTNFTGADILVNASVNDTLSKVFNVSFRIYNSSTNATQWIDASIGQGNYDQGVWNATISSSTLVNGYYNVTINATDYAGNQFVRNISSFNVSNALESAPVVYNVTPAVITPTAGSYTANLVIRFNVSDEDGVADLDNTKARVNVTQFVPGAGFINRTNTSGNCEVITSSFNSGKHRTYSCIVPIRYYDNASSKWQINASISDSTNRVHGNSSQNATINSLSAFSMASSSLSMTAGMGSANNELTFTINNTGNFNFTKLNLTPYALNASLTDFFMLGGETADERGSANFSFNTTSSASGFGIGLTNATPINISNNYEIGNAGSPVAFGIATGQDADISKANMTFYIYIDIPNAKGLSSGVTYNASPALPWEIIAQ